MSNTWQKIYVFFFFNLPTNIKFKVSTIWFQDRYWQPLVKICQVSAVTKCLNLLLNVGETRQLIISKHNCGRKIENFANKTRQDYMFLKFFSRGISVLLYHQSVCYLNRIELWTIRENQFVWHRQEVSLYCGKLMSLKLSRLAQFACYSSNKRKKIFCYWIITKAFVVLFYILVIIC